MDRSQSRAWCLRNISLILHFLQMRRETVMRGEGCTMPSVSVYNVLLGGGFYRPDAVRRSCAAWLDVPRLSAHSFGIIAVRAHTSGSLNSPLYFSHRQGDHLSPPPPPLPGHHTFHTASIKSPEFSPGTPLPSNHKTEAVQRTGQSHEAPKTFFCSGPFKHVMLHPPLEVTVTNYTLKGVGCFFFLRTRWW